VKYEIIALKEGGAIRALRDVRMLQAPGRRGLGFTDRDFTTLLIQQASAAGKG